MEEINPKMQAIGFNLSLSVSRLLEYYRYSIEGPYQPENDELGLNKLFSPSPLFEHMLIKENIQNQPKKEDFIRKKINYESNYQIYLVKTAINEGYENIPNNLKESGPYLGFGIHKSFIDMFSGKFFTENEEKNLLKKNEDYQKDYQRHFINTGNILSKTKNGYSLTNISNSKVSKDYEKQPSQKYFEFLDPDFVRECPIFLKTCEYCGRIFATTNNNQKYCYHECKKNQYIKSRREKGNNKIYSLNEERICPICGNSITGRADKKTCGKDACRKAYYRKYGSLRKNND